MRSLRLGRVMAIGTALILLATAAQAEQRWQCGDGLSVPLEGTKSEREAACKAAREKRDLPPRDELSPQKANELQDRVEKLEKQYGLDIDVKYK